MGSGTVAGTALRVLCTTVPDPILIHAEICFEDLTNRHRHVIVEVAMIIGRTILQPFPFTF